MEDEQYKRSLAGVSNLGWKPNDSKEELKDVINKLSNKLSIAEKALEFYATPEVYFCEGIFEKPETWKQNEEMNPYVENMMDDDSGERARKALAVIRGEKKSNSSGHVLRRLMKK